MKLFNMGKNIKIKIFIRNMVGQMVKKSGRARFYLLCNHSCTLHFSGKKLLVKSKNFSLLKLWRIKIETKNKKDAKMVGFIKTCNQYTHKFNLVIFFQLFQFLLPPFLLGDVSSKNAAWRKWVISFCSQVMIRTCESVAWCHE